MSRYHGLKDYNFSSFFFLFDKSWKIIVGDKNSAWENKYMKFLRALVFFLFFSLNCFKLREHSLNNIGINVLVTIKDWRFLFSLMNWNQKKMWLGGRDRRSCAGFTGIQADRLDSRKPPEMRKEGKNRNPRAQEARGMDGLPWGNRRKDTGRVLISGRILIWIRIRGHIIKK